MFFISVSGNSVTQFPRDKWNLGVIPDSSFSPVTLPNLWQVPLVLLHLSQSIHFFPCSLMLLWLRSPALLFQTTAKTRDISSHLTSGGVSFGSVLSNASMARFLKRVWPCHISAPSSSLPYTALHFIQPPPGTTAFHGMPSASLPGLSCCHPDPRIFNLGVHDFSPFLNAVTHLCLQFCMWFSSGFTCLD